MSNSNSNLEHKDFPAIYQAADIASTTAQRSFLVCLGVDLILIVSSAFVSSFSIADASAKTALAFTAAILTGLGLILTIYIRSQHYEQDWYDGRAIAESVKTRVWRFVTCSEPYLENLSSSEVDKIFIENLIDVAKERRKFIASIGADIGLNQEITDRMREIRSLTFEERKAFYTSNRINDQRDWYSKKSKNNKNLVNAWFNGIIFSQLGAIIAAFCLIKWPEFPINTISIFAAISAACLAWLQLKRHQELANSYGLAAQELGFIAEQIRYVDSPEKLSHFILDAENAISREHTLWIARRDQV